jgi:hypothetical protein
MVTAAFPDLPADSPFSDAVARVIELGMMRGFSDGTFRPDEGVVAEDFAAMLGTAMAGSRATPDDLSGIFENPVLELEADEPIPRLRAIIVAVDAIDKARPGLVPDVTGILEHLRVMAGDTREFARARDAGLLAVLFDHWSDRLGLGTPPTEPMPPADFMDGPMSRAETAQLLVNVMQLVRP